MVGKPIKVSFNISPIDKKLIEESASLLGISASDVIRHAIALERLAYECRTSNGEKKLLFYEDQYIFGIYCCTSIYQLA